MRRGCSKTEARDGDPRAPARRRGGQAGAATETGGHPPPALLAALVRELLRGGGRGRPVRTLLELVARLAPVSLALAAFTVTWGGSSGESVALRLVNLLVLLVAVAAADQWLVVPLLRGLSRLGGLIARRGSARDRSGQPCASTPSPSAPGGVSSPGSDGPSPPTGSVP